MQSEQTYLVSTPTKMPICAVDELPISESLKSFVIPNPFVSTPIGVTASDCRFGSQRKATHNTPSIVYAVGTIGYDFGSETRRNSFLQQGLTAPEDPIAFATFLARNPDSAREVTWVLYQESTPVYAIQPADAFAATGYERLRSLLLTQAHVPHRLDKVSIPGSLEGKTRLLGGQTVPVIMPGIRGVYSWSIPKLVVAIAGQSPTAENFATSAEFEEACATYAQQVTEVSNFLEHIYDEIRNPGVTAADRALNYATTNAFQIANVFQSAFRARMSLDAIETTRSRIYRPGADCWDVQLMFCDPQRRFKQARHVYRFIIDVSDVIPVIVGQMRHWDVF